MESETELSQSERNTLSTVLKFREEISAIYQEALELPADYRRKVDRFLLHNPKTSASDFSTWLQPVLDGFLRPFPDSESNEALSQARSESLGEEFIEMRELFGTTVEPESILEKLRSRKTPEKKETWGQVASPKPEPAMTGEYIPSQDEGKGFWSFEWLLAPAAGIWFLAILGYGLFVLVVGFQGIEEGLGLGWAIAALVAFFIFRFSLPFSVGLFYAAVDIWDWHWLGALLIAAPGLAFLVPSFAAVLIERFR